MSKYLCHCGLGFNNKNKAEEHKSRFKDIQDGNYHIIAKKFWRARIIDFALEYPWGKFFRVLGALIIIQVFIRHYGIDFSILEALFLGLGIGFLLNF